MYNNDPCYGIYVAGSAVSISTTLPGLSYDNGSPCALSFPAGSFIVSTVCDGNRFAFVGYLPGQKDPYQDLYTGFDPVADFVYQNVSNTVFLNARGDLLFGDPRNEYIIEALHQTSAVPEPGSLLLLATGALGALAALHRRC